MHIHDHRNDRYNTDMFSNEFSLENKLKLWKRSKNQQYLDVKSLEESFTERNDFTRWRIAKLEPEILMEDRLQNDLTRQEAEEMSTRQFTIDETIDRPRMRWNLLK